MKKWRPGTVEVDSYLVIYRLDGETYGTYVKAEHERDARQQVISRVEGARIVETNMQMPTKKHQKLIDEYAKEQPK